MGHPPVYLDADSDGNAYWFKALRNESESYNFSSELVSKEMMKELLSEREVVLQNREYISLPGESLSPSMSTTSTTCPLPSSFSIWADSNGNALGDTMITNTFRPAGVTTQWIVLDFLSINYRTAGAHLPIALFHEYNMHGWGGFIGDNSNSPVGCDSPYTSQIEAWIQYGEYPQPPSSTWQSVVFENSCGVDLYDGGVFVYPNLYPKYRLIMHASIGHWVAYNILEMKTNPLRWEDITGSIALDVDTGPWPFPHTFNDLAQGIRIFSTPSALGLGGWYVNFYNTQCGWF